MSRVTSEETLSHTPGPWRVDPTHSLCIESNHGNIGLVNLARASKADARLIAAAPRMYELIAKLAKGGDAEAISILESIHASA